MSVWRDTWNAFLSQWTGEECCMLDHSDLDDDTEELYEVDDLENFMNPPWTEGNDETQS